MTRLVKLVLVGLPALLLSVSSAAVSAQATADPTAIGGLRAYWHVFIAYAIVIAAVLGWVISIGKRLKDVQERLDK